MAVASDIVSCRQLSKDENSWRILSVSIVLNNPTECQLSQHLPNSRLLFSGLTSLISHVSIALGVS